MRTLEEIQEDAGRALRDSDYEAPIRCAEELESLGTPDALAVSYKIRGRVYHRSGNYPKALEQFYRALDASTDLGDQSSVASTMVSIGTVNAIRGSYSEALEQFHRGLDIYSELGDRHGVALATGNIGLVYQKIGSYPEALEHLHSALDMHTELGERDSVARVLGNIGMVQGLMGNGPKALEHFRHALDFQGEFGDRRLVANTTANIINTLLGMEQFAEAEVLLLEMESMQVDEPELVVIRQQHLATIKDHYGDVEAAKAALHKGLEIAGHHNLAKVQATTHKLLRDLALKQKDLQAYAEHNDQYERITEEVRGRETIYRVTMIEGEKMVMAERQEREKERALLYGTLPESVAKRLLRGETVTGDHYENAVVIFQDIVGFTELSDKIPPGHVVHLLGQIFSALDEVCKAHGVTKIKTIGDSYMAVAGVPEPLADHIQRAALCAVEMLATLNDLQLTMPPKQGDTAWIKDVGEINVRIGLHCGPVTAGVIGTQRLQYDVWGDTVNVASRMESTGEAGRIQVSSGFAELLRLQLAVAEEEGTANSNCQLQLRERGAIEVKGKGSMTTYWLEGA